MKPHVPSWDGEVGFVQSPPPTLTLFPWRKTKVPAGGSLSVDRELFSSKVTEYLKGMEHINIINEEITEIDTQIPTIIASGPLTSDTLSKFIAKFLELTVMIQMDFL